MFEATCRIIIVSMLVLLLLPMRTMAQAVTSTLQSAATGNGNGAILRVLGAATVVLTVNCNACAGGTQVNFQASQDGVNYTPIAGVPSSAVPATAPAVSTTTPGVTAWKFDVAGFQSLRAPVSNYSTGSVTATGTATLAAMRWRPDGGNVLIGPSGLDLTRVFNNPGGSATGSTAFWMLGQPFRNTFSGAPSDEVPSTNIVTCTLGGQAGDSDPQASVPCSLAERKYANDGSVEWGQLLVDFSGRTISAGGKDTLVLTSAAGTFCDAQGTGTCTSGFTKSSWDTLGDVVTLSSVGLAPPPPVGLSCSSSSSGFANGTVFVAEITFTTAAGETLPNAPNSFTITTSGCGGTAPAAFVVAPGNGASNISAITGWNLYACTGVNCSPTKCSSQTGFASNLTLTTISGCSGAPPTTNTAGPIQAPIAGSGTWTAKFDGGVEDETTPGNTETVIADTPQGREVKVASYLWDTTAITPSSATHSGTTETVNFSPAVNINSNDGIIFNTAGGQAAVCSALHGNPLSVTGGSEGAASQVQCTLASSPGTVTTISVINRNIQVVMYYWATCKAVGTVCTTAGPVESWGPFVENILLYPKTSGAYANSTLMGFTLNAAYDRNGSAVRDCASANAYCGITLSAQAIANMTRADAQGDWTASDPGIYVTQAYDSVVNTRKVPPFTRGVTYGGTQISQNAPLTGVSGNILQFNAAVFMGSGSVAQLLDFKSVGSLTGVSTGIVYAAAPTTGGACLYDTLTHAQATMESLGASSCSGTGLVTIGNPSGFSGAVLENAAGPMAVGQTEVAIQATGSGPMLALVGEWAAAYLVGNTQAWERIGRVQAYDWAAYVNWGLDAATGRIPCLIDAQGTSGSGDAGCPSTSGALGTAYVNDMWAESGAFSNDINNGKPSPSGTLPWTTGVGDPEHVPSLVFGIWLMEGSPFLQDLVLLGAEGNMANTGTGHRNNQVINLGSTYHGNTTGVLFQERAPAWTQRDLAYGAFAAPNGSLEESYFRTMLNSTFAWNVAYRAAQGTNYTAMGYIGADEQNFQNPQTVSNPVQNGSAEAFMQSYLAGATGMGALLEGDYVTGYTTELAQHLKWLGGFYGNGVCPYYGSIYIHTPGRSAYNTASLSQSWISQVAAGTAVGAGVGLTTGNGAYTTFPSSGTGLTLGASNQKPWTVVVGDKVRFLDYDISGGAFNNSQCPGTSGGHCPEPPTAFTVGQDYYIVSISGLNYTVSATSGGSAISSNGAATNVGTVFIPSAASCPSGAFAPTTQDPPDNYYFYQYAALALLAENGVSGALTDYNNAAALFTSGSNCAHLMNWCLTPP